MASWHRKIVGRRLWLSGLLRKSCFITLNPYIHKHNERSFDNYLSVYASEIRQQTTRINSKYTNAPIKRTANAPHDQHDNFKVYIYIRSCIAALPSEYPLQCTQFSHALQICHMTTVYKITGKYKVSSMQRIISVARPSQ